MREVEFVPKGDRLRRIDENSGKTKEEELLEFCQTPRLGRELYAWLGLKASAYAIKTFIKPLVDEGKLLLTLPNFPTSNNQRYVTAGFETVIASNENILEYCKVPRRKKEIAEHFGFSDFTLRQHIDPLIISGKLKGSDTYNPKNNWQRYVNADADAPITTEKMIVEFCTEPRSRKEIVGHLGLHIKYIYKFLAPLVESGIIKMTKPEMPTSIDQRYVNTDADVIILTDDAVITFCKTPKTRAEVAERFELKRHNADKILNDLVHKDSLKITNQLCPQSWHQKFVQPQVDITILSEESLLEFCKTPRTKTEIRTHFGINNKATMGKYLYPLINERKLRHTIPHQPNSKLQKYVTIEQ